MTLDLKQYAAVDAVGAETLNHDAPQEIGCRIVCGGKTLTRTEGRMPWRNEDGPTWDRYSDLHVVTLGWSPVEVFSHDVPPGDLGTVVRTPDAGCWVSEGRGLWRSPMTAGTVTARRVAEVGWIRVPSPQEAFLQRDRDALEAELLAAQRAEETPEDRYWRLRQELVVAAREVGIRIGFTVSFLDAGRPDLDAIRFRPGTERSVEVAGPGKATAVRPEETEHLHWGNC